MPKSKPPRRKFNPNRVAEVRPRWLRGKLYERYHALMPAIARDDALTVEWACRRLLLEVQPLVEEDVAQARRAGATWQQIADGLDITKQAAQKRFGHLVSS